MEHLEANRKVRLFFCRKYIVHVIKLLIFACWRNHLNICFIGDIVAAPGRNVIKNLLPGFLASNNIDFCIVNAENSTHGLGVSARVIDELTKLGVDCITLGNHAFSNYDFFTQANKYNYVIRPDNVNDKWPGKGYTVITKSGQSIGVMNLMGQVGMNPCSNDPFAKADEILEAFREKKVNTIILDFHAEATSEKQAMGYYLDGKVSAVLGTHTHVQTADSRVLPNGTGYITDCGMTGCVESIIGMDIDTSLTRFVEKIPAKYQPAEGDAFMCGVILEINSTGRCDGIRRFCEYG